MYGEVTEWLKVHAWKVCVLSNGHREFESHPLRQERNNQSTGLVVSL